MGLFDGLLNRSGAATKRLDEARKRQQADPANIALANALVEALLAEGMKKSAVDVIRRTGAALEKQGRHLDAILVYSRVNQIDPRGEVDATFLIQHQLKSLQHESGKSQSGSSPQGVPAQSPPSSQNNPIAAPPSGSMQRSTSSDAVTPVRAPGSGMYRAAASDPSGDPVKQGIARVPILRDAPQAVQELFLSRLVHRRVAAGEYVFRQGEETGPLYFVAEGELILQGKNDGGWDMTLETLREGDVAGVLSYLSGKPRSLTLVSQSRCELLELPRSAMDSPLRRYRKLDDALKAIARDRAIRVLIAKSRAFRNLSEAGRADLAQRLMPLTAAPGSRIMEEGAAESTLYVLKSGTVRVTKLHQGREVAIADLEPHECFGDVAALHGTPRTTSVTALTDVEYFALVRSDLLEIIETNPRVKEDLDAIQMERFVEEARILTA